MEEFQMPEDLGNLSALQVETAGRFCASPGLPSLADETPDRLNDLLDSLRARLTEGDADALSQQENFDDLFSLVRDFKHLRSEIKGRVLSILHDTVERTVSALGKIGRRGNGRSNGRRRGSIEGDGGEGSSQQQQQQQQHGQAELPLRNAFKMSVYLLYSAAFPSEECYSSAKQTAGLTKQPAKGKGSRGGGGGRKSSPDGGAFKWETARQAVLESMRLALTVDSSRLWRQGIPDRSFMSLFLRLSCKMLELPETSRGGSRQAELASQLIAEPFNLVQGMETEVTAAVFLLVRECRHLAEFVARLCWRLVERHGDSRLGAELAREVGRMEMPDINSKNTAAAAPVINVSEFLQKLVEVLPGTVHANASVLHPHLSSRPYQIRQAVVLILAEVVTAAHEDKAASEDGADGGRAAAEGAAAAGGGSNGGEDESQAQADPRRVRMTDHDRDGLLNDLMERALDVSPYVRVAVLRSWGKIAERGALPRKRFLNAARLGRDRLRDQSSLVRKEAVKLLSTLLEYNPYNSTLDLKINEARSKQAEAELRAMSPAQSEGAEGEADQQPEVDRVGSDGDGERDAGSGDEGDNDLEEEEEEGKVGSENEDEAGGEGEEQEEGAEEEKKEAEDGVDGNGGGEQDGGDELTKEQVEVAMKAAQCHHLRAAVLFIKEFEAAGSNLEGLLGSTTVTDVVETLKYFVTACHFQLPGALEAIKKSLTLVWRTEPAIETAIKNAFVQVFVQPESNDEEDDSPPPDGGANAAQFVAKNLVNLVNESKAGELASLEEVVASLVKDSLAALKENKTAVIDPEVFEQLWCAVGRKGQSPKARAGALHAIAMGSSTNPALVNDLSRLEVIRETALGRATMESRDWRTVRCACIALLRCDPGVVLKGKEVDLILPRLIYFLQGKWCVAVTGETSDDERAAADGEMKSWFAAAEQAIAVLFHLNRAPEALGAAVVRRIAADTLSSDSASPHALARLCFVLGHLALKLLVYSEDLAGNLERARAKVKPPTKEKGSGGGGDSSDDDDATAQELGLNAEASAEDEQRLTELVEKEIVGRNLLGAFGPLLVRLVADEGGCFGHPLLRESSVLALSKFMCISEAFCERNLSLLFTTLERSKDTAVRANIIVALGDLAFRFPNALEPWNPHIYNRLKDDSPGVRANAIMVLTHLILNDMVKVKGQVSGLAVCMVDEEPRIRDAAKVFFNKYSERGTNPVYNVLPDIVGRLSVDETVDPHEYQEIMDFLMQYVKKDKLTELLAEKLCARLAASETDRQARAVSYCLGQLKVTEKAVSRLAELVPTYKEKLQDEEVFNNFKTVVSRTKSFATLEMKEAVAEWEAQLRKYHEGGAEDEDAAARATRAAGRKRSRGGKRSSVASSSSGGGGGVSRTGGRRKEAATDSEGPIEGIESNTSATKQAGSTRRKGKHKKASPVLSSDSESDEEEVAEGDDGDTSAEEGDDDHEENEVEEQSRAKKASARDRGKVKGTRGRGVAAVKEEQEEEEEAIWGSEEEVFEKIPPRRGVSEKGDKSRASKENRAEGGKASGRGSRRSRNASPLTSKN